MTGRGVRGLGGQRVRGSGDRGVYIFYGTVRFILLKGAGGYIRDGTATLPVGGSPLNQFKALTKICTSSHISMDQITISMQHLSMLHMNVS